VNQPPRVSLLVPLVVVAFSAAGAFGEPPQILSVKPLTERPVQYETFELKLVIKARHENPFDNSDIQVTAQFQHADGTLYVVGGFVYQDFTRSLREDGLEVLSPVGDAEWRVRFTPPQPGEYSYIVAVTTADGRTFSTQKTFACEGSTSDGFVRTIAGRYFQYDSGRPFFCLGQNLAWSKGAGTYDYDRWLEGLAQAGANYARIWLWRNPAFDLELMPQVDIRNGTITSGGVGRYDLANAWRLDYVLQRCEELGIKVMLCFFDFHPLTENFNWFGTTYHPWDNCVYNVINGGPLDDPADFFTDEKAQAAARQLIRYVINRYGHSTAIHCWELFNEIDLAPGYRSRFADIRDWHDRMARFITFLDPYKRPVTTSCAEPYARSRIWSLPGIHIVQSHSYNEKDMGESVPLFVRDFDPLGKPHIVGEIGNNVNLGKPEDAEDPAALHLHNAIWAAMASGSAGGPLTWWWDTYIDPLNLYSIYTAPSRFAATIDWCAQQLAPTAVQIQSAADDIKRNVRLNGYIHGVAHRDELGAGPTIELDYAHDGVFTIHVDKVAAGAALRVYLDSRLAISEDLPASKARGSWKSITWHQDYQYWEATYDRDFAISVPKGKHVLTIRNDGQDWMTISDIRLLNYTERGVVDRIPIDTEWGKAAFSEFKLERDGTLTGYRTISLRALALKGSRTALAWVQNKENTWYNRRGDASQPEPARGLLVFPGLGPGAYTIQRWNTYTGEIEQTFDTIVDEGATLSFITPLISTDVAYRIEKLSRPAPKPGPPASETSTAVPETGPRQADP